LKEISVCNRELCAVGIREIATFDCECLMKKA